MALKDPNNTQETTVKVVQYGSYKEAQKNLEKGQKLDNNMTKICVKKMLRNFPEFDGKEYTREMFLSVLNEKDSKTLQSICPLNLHKMNMTKNEEQERFFVENYSIHQMALTPLVCFKQIHTVNLRYMAERFTREEYAKEGRHISYYLVKGRNNPDKTICEIPDGDLYNIIWTQVEYNQVHLKFKNTNTDFTEILNKDVITLGEIALYMNLHKQYVSVWYFNNEETVFNKYLKPADKSAKPRTYSYPFTTESFKELLKHIYTGNPEEACENEKLYDWKTVENLIGDSKGKINKSVVYRAIKRGKLNCYRVSKKNIRFSRKDFEMYFKSREGDIESGRWERIVIQIPVNATQDEIDKIFDGYIEENEAWNRLAVSIKPVEDLVNVSGLPAVKILRPKLNRYFSREKNKTYFKVSEINNVISEYYGKNVDGEFVKSTKKFDLKRAGKLYRINDIVQPLHEKYPEKSLPRLRVIISQMTREGDVCFVNLGERRHLYCLEDVLKVYGEKFDQSSENC